MEIGEAPMLSKKACLLSITIVVVVLITLQPVQGSETVEQTSDFYLYVDRTGSAHADGSIQYPPSDFADYYKNAAKSNAQQVKEAIKDGLQEGYSHIGFEPKNWKLELNGLNPGETFTVDVEFDIEDFAKFNAEDNIWVINFAPPSPIDYAQYQIQGTEEIQTLVAGLFPGVSQFRTTRKTTYILPENAEILHSDELENLNTVWDYGGGSYENAVVHLGEVNGHPSITQEGESLIVIHTDVTITPEELAQQCQGWSIEYTGFPPPPESSNLLLYAGLTAVVVIAVLVLVFLKRRGGGEEWVEPAEGWKF